MMASRVPVLMYHEVRWARGDWERQYVVEPARFGAQLQALRFAGYRPISLKEFRSWMTQREPLPENPVLITFDDGYEGVYEHAYPLLKAESLPFAVFVVSGAVGKTDAWMYGATAGKPAYALMTRSQLTELARAGGEIGAHSRSHADLAALKNAGVLAAEIAGCRADLEELLQQPVRCFAYPYGRWNEAVRTAVADAGYDCAFSTRSGFNRAGDDPLLVRRIEVRGTDSAASLLRKLRYGTNDGSLMATGRYYMRQALTRMGMGAR